MICSEKTFFLLWLNWLSYYYKSWFGTSTTLARKGAILNQEAVIWKCVGIHPAAPRIMNPHRWPPRAARSERVIRRWRPIKLSPWEKPTSWLPFELPTLAATSFICQSIQQCPRSALPQPGIVENPAPQGDRRGLWPVALHQEASTDKNTVKIKARDQLSVSVSPHSIYEIGLCALRCECMSRGSEAWV